MPRTMAFTSMTAGLLLLAVSGVMTLELMLPAATVPLPVLLGGSTAATAALPALPIGHG
ncbi:hypothetical protein GCM10007301_08710 [Azorhizobium oxalatiphilum]|uniref:Uncharacterized protein n=1 Tax=Azorhizobium oxalatiphilum TaxID=980631 RepID=A0A917F5A9_9HYPH|nr:hypothetical protein [Azorhizobium oxalatiphilum]GGF51506.1 hypothetical protein GCM10007301_08710 [Azorhizobium oxalatiphilum]